MTNRITSYAISLLLALAPCLLGSAELGAQGGKLNIVAKFPASAFGGELNLATYTENNERVGLLSIARDKRVSERNDLLAVAPATADLLAKCCVVDTGLQPL